MCITATYVEIERKYNVRGDASSLDLSGLEEALPEGLSVVAGDVEELDATYFDTSDHLLFHAAWTLRRRTGGSDAGWHLKLPDGRDSRLEVRQGLGRSTLTVPLALRRFSWIHTRGAPLVPIVRVATSRSTHRVCGDGEVLVEIAADDVQAWRLGAAESSDLDPPLTWQEIEVELVAGDRDLLKVVHTWLKHHGARRSASRSKLAQALGQEPMATGGRDPDVEELTAKATGGDVIGRYLREQIAEIHQQDPQVRLKAPDSVHQMRVATRRLRSALKTFAPLYVGDATRRLRAELKWLADELGRARDAEVRRGRLRDELDEESGKQLVSRGVRSAVDSQAARELRGAVTALTGALNSERYQLLIVALDELVDNPPLTARAGKVAARTLPKRVARAYREVAVSMRASARLDDGPERDEILHAARKSAKRARYASEAVAPTFGKPARRFALAMETLQDHLGEHHDGVVLAARLRALALGEDSAAAAFTYGRLHAHQEQRRIGIDAAIDTAWRRAADASLRSWLS